MMSTLRLLVVLGLAACASAKKEAAVIVLDPLWDDSDAFAHYVPLLKDFELVKVMITQGNSFSFYKNMPPAKVYRRFEYQSKTADAFKATDQICPQLKAMDVKVAAVIPTSDPTVQLADLLNHCLGLRGNPAFGPLATARRDKWTMGESVCKAGLRCVGQKRVSTWPEVRDFLESWEPPLSEKRPCVFKIPNGVAGIGDFEVTSMKQAKEIFQQMSGNSFQGVAGTVDTFLIQEYLKGREYAVDSVSRDGVHKVVAVWFEDFRPANGIFDQYFGFKLLDPADEFTKKIIDYAKKSLDAIGLYNGAANTEIKYLEDEHQPCLVETNARWAGINWNDGLTVEQKALGNDQITAAFTAHLDGPGFDKMPDVLSLKHQGAMIFGINYNAGLLTGVPGFEDAKKYPSYLNSYLQCDIGKYMAPTTPSTAPFTIGFVSDSKADVDADYARVIEREKDGSFYTIVPEAQLIATRTNSVAFTTVLAMFALIAAAAAMFFRKQPKDDTEYLPIM